MPSKKIILILSVFILTIPFSILGCYVFLKQNSDETQVAQKCGEINNPHVKPDEENSNTGMTKEWNTYYDERYQYKIDFPAGLNATNIYEHTRTVELSKDLGGGFLTLTTNGGITFSPVDLPLSVIAMEIFENSKFKSLAEWLESEKNEYVSMIVEKKINIDGNEAIITHQAGMRDEKIYEEYKNPKTTVFIKNNMLFIITTNMDDNDSEKVWNSFKFITGRYPIY